VILKIVQVGDPGLREAARALIPDEIRSARIQQLIELMRDTLRDAPGVGLAAPQIGESLQLAVIEDLAEYQKGLTPEDLAERGRKPVPFHVIVNPRIEFIGGETAEFFEGCLSLPGFAALVERAARVRVECLNELAEPVTIDAKGWYARILQHEIDHLRGDLYVDRMRSRSLTTLDNFNRRKRTMNGLAAQNNAD
jgi:peptide deformylase